MGENKGQTIFLSVIGIATLLVAIIGATFAYFTTTLNTNETTATGTTAKISNVTLASTNLTVNDLVLPGTELGDLKFHVAADLTGDVEIGYKCTMTNNGTVKALSYRHVMNDNSTAAATTSTGAYTKWYTLGTPDSTTDVATITGGEPVVFTGNLTSSVHSQTHAVGFRYDETATNQTEAESDKGISVSVVCALDNNAVYYTGTDFSGTATKPSASN